MSGPPPGPILFVRGGALGDFVLTLPVLAACFASGRRVDVACAPRFLPLVHLVGRPGYAWDVEGAESAWMFGGADPVGYGLAVRFAASRAELPVPVHLHVAARPPSGVRAGDHFGSVWPAAWGAVDPALRVSAPPLRAGRPVVLAPGASDPRRSWPLDRWLGLRDCLAHRFEVVLVGGPLEPWADYRPDLPELIGLAAAAGAWIGPDSGPTHLAARLGAPTLAVWGPTDPAWAPVGASVLPATADDATVVAWVEHATMGAAPRPG